MNAWTLISTIGSTRLADTNDLRELTLLNRIVAVSTVNLCCFIPVGLYFEMYDVAIYVLAGILLSLGTLLLNYFGYFKFARTYYLLLAVAFVTFLLIALSGKNGGTQIV